MQEEAYDNLDWPPTQPELDEFSSNTSVDPLDVVAVVSKLVGSWQNERDAYPGWVILPKDLRSKLWTASERGRSVFPPQTELPGLLDLRWAYEVVWRYEKCLTPLHTDDLTYLEETINRYIPESFAANTSAVSPHGRALASLTCSGTIEPLHMWHYLLIVLLRSYREEGRGHDWRRIAMSLRHQLPTLCARHRARFYYESALCALYELKLQNLKRCLDDWPPDVQLPFWEAKRANLLAYIGEIHEAENILDTSLAVIRQSTSLSPVMGDYSKVSQESYVLVLLNYVKQITRYEPGSATSIQDLLRDIRDRWNQLKQYKCDPWSELDYFTQRLARDPSDDQDQSIRATFDLGRSTTTYSFGARPSYLVAYRYLRFREDCALPIQASLKSTVSAAGRIVGSNRDWATAVFIQTGAQTEIDKILNRESLISFDTAYIDSLTLRCIDSLQPSLEEGDTKASQMWADQFDDMLARVIPEILSRLCVKASEQTKYRVFECLIEIYATSDKWKFHGVANLTRRLMSALDVHQRITLIPRLLEIPIPSMSGGGQAQEFSNPFRWLNLSKQLVLPKPTVCPHRIGQLIDTASDSDAFARKWALCSLEILHRLGLLGQRHTQSMANALWSRLDREGLPTDTGFDRGYLMALPAPQPKELVSTFKRYVCNSRFVEADGKRVSIQRGHPICREIVEASVHVDWTDDEITHILDRLFEWWQADKHKLKTGDRGHFLSIGEEYRARFLDLIGVVEALVRPSVTLGTTAKHQLETFLLEMPTYGLPTLQLQVAMLHIVPSIQENTVASIKSALASASRSIVVDALKAVLALLSRAELVQRAEQLNVRHDLVRTVVDVVYWRRKPALTAAINTVAHMVAEYRWSIDADAEARILQALRHIASDTRYVTGERFDRGSTEGVDIAVKLMVRQAAAYLASTLDRHYSLQGSAVPSVIAEWETVCQSEDEYAEIRNQWMSPSELGSERR